MWKLHRKLNFPNIFWLAAIYTWAPAKTLWRRREKSVTYIKMRGRMNSARHPEWLECKTIAFIPKNFTFIFIQANININVYLHVTWMMLNFFFLVFTQKSTSRAFITVACLLFCIMLNLQLFHKEVLYKSILYLHAWFLKLKNIYHPNKNLETKFSASLFSVDRIRKRCLKLA